MAADAELRQKVRGCDADLRACSVDLRLRPPHVGTLLDEL